MSGPFAAALSANAAAASVARYISSSGHGSGGGVGGGAGSSGGDSKGGHSGIAAAGAVSDSNSSSILLLEWVGRASVEASAMPSGAGGRLSHKIGMLPSVQHLKTENHKIQMQIPKWK